MHVSTGKNFDNIQSFLQNTTDAELVSSIASQYLRKDLPDDITDKLKKCDIPHVVNDKLEFKVYFSCCSTQETILCLEVKTRFPDLISKQIYDLLLQKKVA